MKPGDRLVCALVDPIEVGTTFQEWPLHVTIVPWFRLDMPSDRMASMLASNLAQIHSFDVRLDGTDHFGKARKKLVHLVAAPSPLWDIEYIVRALLHRQRAWIADETTKSKRSYLPHITHQAHAAPQDGSSFSCTALYIIEQQGEHKMIMGKVELAV